MSSLGNDLVTLRKEQHLSINDMQQITKISLPILQSIEDESIFDQPDANPTYTRSYIRSYARALGLKEQDILIALNELQAGHYHGRLLEKESSANAKKEEQNASESTKHHPSPPQKAAEKSPQVVPHKSTPKKASDDWDWAYVGKEIEDPGTGFSPKNRLLLLLLLLVVLAGGVVLYYYLSGNSEHVSSVSTNQVQPESPSDSLKKALVETSHESVAENTTPTKSGRLPDTLSLSIYAAYGKLEPVRVYTDIHGKRNPYWVSRGDTITFKFVNAIRIRAVHQYERLQVLFDGDTIPRVYEQYYNPEAGAIELKRPTFQNHLEWW